MPGARIISEFSAFKLSKIGFYHSSGPNANKCFENLFGSHPLNHDSRPMP